MTILFLFCEMIENKIQAKYYYLSPCEVHGNIESIRNDYTIRKN